MLCPWRTLTLLLTFFHSLFVLWHCSSRASWPFSGSEQEGYSLEQIRRDVGSVCECLSCSSCLPVTCTPPTRYQVACGTDFPFCCPLTYVLLLVPRACARGVQAERHQVARGAVYLGQEAEAPAGQEARRAGERAWRRRQRRRVFAAQRDPRHRAHPRGGRDHVRTRHGETKHATHVTKLSVGRAVW